MSNQLLIYRQVAPISKEKHGDWSLKMTTDYSFAKTVNSFPLLSAEFAQAANIYPIVFAGTADAVMPAAIVGIQDQNNLFVDGEGSWQARYIPAFIRRYPFVFSSGDSGNTFTVCIDEEFSGWNQEGLGERLFDSEGNQTQYLRNVVNFLQGYQSQFLVTEAFCQKLKELDLLEPMQAQFTVAGGEPSSLGGFLGVNRDKLQALSKDQVFELMQTGWLELIYLHLQSMSLFTELAQKVATTDTPATSEAA